MGDKKKDDAGKGGTIQWKTISGKEGVMYREHPTRRHGRTADRCLSIRYRTGDGKRHHESLGWTSQGWTIAHAVSLLRELKENIRLGLRPQSLREKREMAMRRQKEEERQAILAKVDRAVNEPALIEELADFVHRQGGIEAAAAVMNAYLDRARSIIRTYDESEYRRSLEMLCDYIGARNY